MPLQVFEKTCWRAARPAGLSPDADVAPARAILADDDGLLARQAEVIAAELDHGERSFSNAGSRLRQRSSTSWIRSTSGWMMRAPFRARRYRAW